MEIQHHVEQRNQWDYAVTKGCILLTWATHVKGQNIRPIENWQRICPRWSSQPLVWVGILIMGTKNVHLVFSLTLKCMACKFSPIDALSIKISSTCLCAHWVYSINCLLFQLCAIILLLCSTVHNKYSGILGCCSFINRKPVCSAQYQFHYALAISLLPCFPATFQGPKPFKAVT